MYAFRNLFLHGLAASAVTLLAAHQQPLEAADAPRPNIVIILADDKCDIARC